MKFTKPPLTFDEQVAHLRARGMLGDASEINRHLQSVNYYRLSAYWHTFRDVSGQRFHPGTHFDVVWARYVFDRELRLLVMDAVERFEVAVRARLAYEHAHAGGPFGYAEVPEAVFAGRSPERKRFFDQLAEALSKNGHEPFVRHFVTTYGDAHAHPPVWVAVEVLMFGDVVRLFRGSPHSVQRRVADYFGVAPPVLGSWLLALNVIRNLCAHHGRLWNRELGVKPMIPRNSAWKAPVEVKPERVFAVLTILADLMHTVSPRSHWATRARTLVEEATHIPPAMMGFPADWTRSEVWSRAWAGAETGR